MAYLNEDGLETLVGKIKGQVIELTSAEYRQLPATKNSDNKLYFVNDEAYAYQIDDEPTSGSSGLVKSGGVYNWTSKIGSGTLTTTAQTIIPAVNELNSKIGSTDISSIGDGSLTGAVDELNTGVSRIRNVATLLTQRLISTSNTKYTLNESVSNFALIAVVCGWNNNNVLDTVVMPSAVWSSNQTDAMRLWVNRQPSANIYVDVKSRTATTLYCQSNNSNVSVGVYGILRVN